MSLATRSLSIACSLSFASMVFGASAAAQPEPPAATASSVKPLSDALTGLAKAEYEAGKILYGDKDYANAIVKFERAYDLSHEPRLLWNIAVCQKNLRRYAKMLVTIRRYREEAGPMLSAEEKDRAAEIVKTVATFVSGLKLVASEAGAEVFVDDEKVGMTPLPGPVIVDVGVRKIRVSKRGFKDGIRSLQVAGGGEVALDISLEKELHKGRLVVVAGPKDLIAVDGKAVGIERWEGVVTTGGHTLRVTAQGMAAYQSEAVVQDNQVRRIDVSLNPLPKADGGRTALWIAAGALLTTGAAIGGAVLFKPAETTPVQGNIAPGTVQLSYRGRR